MLLSEAEHGEEMRDLAERRYLTCAHRRACDRATERNSSEETYDFLRCEECEIWKEQR